MNKPLFTTEPYRPKVEAANDADQTIPRKTITATPFKWIDPTTIPCRRWIYGRHYIREFIAATIAARAVGKSSLSLVELLAIATGLSLLGVTPAEQTNVWCWNGEDPRDELQRRFAAAMLHYGIDPSAVEGRLFVDTGREQKIIIVEQTRDGTKIARPIVDDVIATIKANKIGVMTVDPFVACHRVTENDNPAIEAVVNAWAEIAEVTCCSIELVHHPRKTNGAEVTTEDSRGASALLFKARSGRALNQMTKDEAERASVENRRAYFRVENGKENMSLPSDQADWYRLVSVDLPNGDSVGVVTAWSWPDAFEGVTVADLRKAQAVIAAGGPWRENSQAKNWAGNAIATAMGLDPTDKAAKAKVASLLKMWTAKRMFVVTEGLDERRRPRSFIEVGEPADD